MTHSGLLSALLEFLGIGPEEEAKRRHQASTDEMLDEFDEWVAQMQGETTHRRVLRGKNRRGGLR